MKNLHMKSNDYSSIKLSRRFVLSFYADFGPVNLAVVYRYCTKLNKKLHVYLYICMRISLKIVFI